MKPRPASLDTLAFTLNLLKRIPRGRKITALELHRQLQAAGYERDVRTVQRQLEQLSAHFDIERDDSSKPFGYKWKVDAAGLSVPGLTEKESLVLALAQQHLAALLPAEVVASMQPFFAQARANLERPVDNPRARAANDWLQKVRVVSTSQPLLPPSIGEGVLETVSKALYRNHWLDVEYENSALRRVAGRVMPLGLAQQGTRLYLVCRFEGHDDERTLAVHRIDGVVDTGLAFERPAGFDLERYDAEGRFGFGNGKRVKLEFLIRRGAGLHLLESRLSEDQQVEEEGDHYRVRAEVPLTEQLKWWLRGFGEDLLVVAPAAVAADVHPQRLEATT
jgi:predicted DNA-binding transcriptional regulator YafY